MGALYSPTNRGKNQFSPIWWQFWGTRFLGNPRYLCDVHHQLHSLHRWLSQESMQSRLLHSSLQSAPSFLPLTIRYARRCQHWLGKCCRSWLDKHTHTLSISSIIAYMCIYKGQYYDIYLHNLITIRCWTPEEGDGDTHTYYIYIYYR